MTGGTFIVLLLIPIVVGLILAAILVPLALVLRKRTARFDVDFAAEVRANHETVVRGPEPGNYRGGTGRHSAVKGNGTIILTDRRLVFRKVSGGVEQVPRSTIIGTREEKTFLGARVGGTTCLVVSTTEPAELGFFVDDLPAWQQALDPAIDTDRPGAMIVLLTGASGLVGTWLRRTAPADVDLVGLTHRHPLPGSVAVGADLRDPRAVTDALARVQPALVIHAAMAVDAASIVDATAHVAASAAAIGADVLYVSTDAVFSGHGRPVDEDATPDPIWDYGRWKAEAEAVVLRSSSGSCVVRLPLVVSLDPEDAAVRKVREGAAAGFPTRWFDDELRRPALAADITPALWRIAALPAEERSGPWHLVGSETLSRFEIAERVARALQLDEHVVEPEPTPAKLVRPRHLDLRSERAEQAIGWNPTPILR